MPHRKRHLVFLCTLLHDVEQYMLCVLHFVDVRSTVLHICSLGQYFQNLFLWSLGSCTCSLNNYLHLSIISLLAPQDEKYSRKIPLEIYIFQKLCGIALFLLNKLETDSFKDIREGRKSNELNWVNYLIIKQEAKIWGKVFLSNRETLLQLSDLQIMHVISCLPNKIINISK